MKKAAARFVLATALFSSCALVGLTPAKATTVTWDLSTCDTSNAGCNPTTHQNYDPGTTETFNPTSGPAADVLKAAAFTSAWVAIDLYNKAGVGDEKGLGTGKNAAGANVDT